MLPDQRDLFSIPPGIAYLNCAYMSPLMKQVQTAGSKAVAIKAHPWEISPADFFSASEDTRALFASLVNADAGDIAIVPSVSYGLAVAAKNLSVEKGQHILCLEDQFPSNVYAWQRMASDNGAGIVTITRDEAREENGYVNWTPAILDAISEKTAIAALPHCLWTDGGIIDLEAVGARAREYGAALVLDITQSGGALDFDISRIKPDFMVCATYKWLLGPYSLGFLYVAPKYQQGRPLEEGWIARAGSENFARLVDYQDAYQDGARRFDMGERTNFHLMPMAAAALGQILEWGVDNIAEALSAKTAAIEARALELGLTAPPRHLRAGHFLGLRFPGGVPDNLAARLGQANVYVSIRGDSMRVTPHLYNTEQDVDQLFQGLEKELGKN